MHEWLTGALAAFAVIVPVELPDKTFVATLVLSTRYRPWPVWAGAVLAFGVQCVLAGAAGRLVALLPALPVRILVTLLFLAGAVLLVRGARAADQELAEQEQEYAQKAGGRRTGWRAFGATFLVLFLAEWGDLSQLLTAGLVASGRPVGSVVVGAWLGLAAVAGLGVLLGRLLLRHVRLQIIRYVGAVICLVLAALTVAAIVGELG